MGTPEKSAAPSFEELVTTAVDKLTPNEDGALILPDDFEASEEVLYAARLEKRRRDTFSSYSKVKNEVKSLRAENQALAEQWEQDATNLSIKEQADLAELKASDPDAYIERIEELKTEAKTKFVERKDEVSKKAKNESEVDRRTRLVEEHNKAHPDMELTDDIIENDVPPRMTKALANGDITFEEFLVKVTDYLSKGKVIGKPDSKEEEPNLGKLGGSSKPEDRAIDADIHESYKKAIF